jgi:hypothetical protein
LLINNVADPGANIGRLILGGYLGNYDLSPANGVKNIANSSFAVFRYCPSIDLSAVPGGLQSSYYMNPHWTFTSASYVANVKGTLTPETSTSPYSVQTAWFRKITDYPKTMAMLTEIYFNPTISSYSGSSSISHPGPGNTAYWNLLLPDGHVATVNDKYAIMTFNVASNTDLTQAGSYNQINSNNNLLGNFDDCLDIWETEADGRAPNAPGKSSAMALPGYSPAMFGLDGQISRNLEQRCFHYPSENMTSPAGNWGY